MCLDEIQREIKEAEHSQDVNIYYQNQENKPPVAPLQDSFDLNFPSTPAKEPVKESFATPCPVSAPPNPNFVTPNNTAPTKVQCSVRMQPFIKTPLTKLYKTEADERRQSEVPPEIAFKKIQVNSVVYTVLNVLGQGGSSEVFHCFDEKNKTHRAIKVVSLQNKVSAVGFINEVHMLKTLQKCNRIIKMFDL